MEFSCQVFHFALPSYLSNSLERVQKRVLSIIYPLTGYADCLQKSSIKSLSDRRVDACEKLFNEITTTPAANMHNHIFYFIYLLVSPYYNTQNYNKNKNNIHDYRQGDRNSVSQLLRARIYHLDTIQITTLDTQGLLLFLRPKRTDLETVFSLHLQGISIILTDNRF
jgi:hypothetical protein